MGPVSMTVHIDPEQLHQILSCVAGSVIGGAVVFLLACIVLRKR